MLTDEEIVKIRDQCCIEHDIALDEFGYNKIDLIVRISRAVIAAHEAKRAMPEEWMSRLQKLLLDYRQGGQRDLAAISQQIVRHLLPPAGMALVPIEPTEHMKQIGRIVQASTGLIDKTYSAMIAAAQKGKA